MPFNCLLVFEESKCSSIQCIEQNIRQGDGRKESEGTVAVHAGIQFIAIGFY